ncbi:MAG: MarR family winged helix-turn-helix transcriptional regulator [Bauldia sp.]
MRRRRTVRTARPQVDLGVLEGLAGFYLRQAQDASFRAFARLSGQHGLKPGRFAALMIIRRNPGISQVALARAIARDKSTVTPLVQEFLEQDLVIRNQSKVDRRSFTLTLTPAGEAVLGELERHATTHDRKIDAIIGKQKTEFIRLLRKIGDHLR